MGRYSRQAAPGGNWRNCLRGTIGLVTLTFCFAASQIFATSGKPANTANGSPRFSLPGGIYTNNLSLTLSANSSTAVVRYTVDGSEPTAQSPAFDKPIGISESILIRAKVFDGESSSNAAVSQAYVLADPDMAGFNSNLPLIIVDTFGNRIRRDQRTPAAVRFIDVKDGGRSLLLGPAEFGGNAEINLRGHTSLRNPKRSYHLKLKDEAHANLKVSLLGLPKESDWVLYGPYSDKTLMRDVLAYDLSNKIGRYAARTRFVELFLCEGGRRLTARNYWGVYVFEEKIKRGKNRVDIAKLGPDENTEPNVSGGYIFKKDHLDEVEPFDNASLAGLGRPSAVKQMGFSSMQGNQFFYVEPKGTELSGKQKAWLNRYVNALERALYSEHFKDPKTGYAAYLDPDSFIDHHLLVELTKNIDGFRFSTFYFKDRAGKLQMGPIWDWNLSLGNATGRQGFNPEGWYWQQLDDQQYSWFRRLFEDPDFQQKYADRWAELRQNQFAPETILRRIDELAALLDEAQARNYNRWRIMGRSVWPNAYVGRSFSDEVNWMKRWTQHRIQWIDEQFVGVPALAPREGPPGTKFTLKAPAGKIYFTLDGTDPRAPGGAVSTGAKVYRDPVVLEPGAVLCARAHEGGRWSGLVRASCPAAGK
jgi:hypothetical protein